MTVEHADWRALGTGVRLLVHHGDLGAARDAVERTLAAVDLAYSRFRPDSELVALNAAAGRAHRVSPLLARAIEGSLRAARRSGGASDPTVGRAMRVIGYDRDFELLTGGAGPIELCLEPVPGWTSITCDPASATVRMPAGTELDLGSTGKGLAADLAAAAAHEASRAAGVLVSLGGDIAIAGEPPAGGWRVLVAEDSGLDPAADGEVVALRHGALATSSTTVRRWSAVDGTSVHHIVDPRTGLPAVTPWRTATVHASSCELANGASTAAIVLGERAPAWFAANGFAARLTATDGRVVRLCGWPEAQAAVEIATGTPS